MTDTNATTLRNALAAAIKNHVTTNGLKAKDAAEIAGVQYSRLSTILRGDLSKVSADALVNILGGFGYRVTGIVGSGDGTEIMLSLDKAEGQVLPEIEKPVEYSSGQTEVNHSCVTLTDSPASPNCVVGVVSEYVNSESQDFESHITGDDHISEVISSNPHLYGDADPDANRVVADDE